MKKNSQKRPRFIKYSKVKPRYVLVGAYYFEDIPIKERPKCTWLGGFEFPPDILEKQKVDKEEYITKPKISNILAEQEKKKD